ncbi:hypothetical protein Q5H91_12050 [Sphingomonas sp. KR1UV-12]|uniref:Tat pathway signal protein n=1 Tax=Sphingomonas aurea TaxID=3063994 RepID=A0ABT9ELV2_9SPHN|nr:hypothetical protein [Sphingomonas sp. KR1UV-12]MDP1027948.1 hypothetical protein [Sphingomonas sp. KR1UV-12]
MDRRRFLAGGTAAAAIAPAAAAAAMPPLGPLGAAASLPVTERFTVDGAGWEVREDWSNRDGMLALVRGDVAVLLPKRTEAMHATATPPWLGLSLKAIAMADADLLADALLAGGGDPDPERVRDAAPPSGSEFEADKLGARLGWTSFVGTRQAGDTMPVFPNGRTRGYRPEHVFPALEGDAGAKTRFEGLLGGWLPAVHKAIPIAGGGWYDLIVFADVDADDPLLVQTWHRTVRVVGGRAVATHYGHSYAPFPPRRQNPDAAAFYTALLRFAIVWQGELADLAPTALPDSALTDMVAHAFAKELVVRPGGTYPKYGVVDRDYVGPEYDGFQDIFTSSVYANLEWGRFAQAKAVFDQYFDRFVGENGMVDMRGPEVPQFGLTLSLVARYLRYTGDIATVARVRGKVAATAQILAELHDQALALPATDRGHGLLHGWSESDACLHPDPSLWWKPYWNNSAWAVRGWRDLARVWPVIGTRAEADGWAARADRLEPHLIARIRQSVRRDLTPPYLGPLPGAEGTWRQALATRKRNEQGWSHRVYAELLQADVLPPDLAALVADCVRGHGGTCIGVTANFAPANADHRDQLGFISYGHARALLRLDQIEEYLLFLHSHRFHSHSRGSWVAGEVSGITGDLPLFCIPAQLTIPLLVRWLLAIEDDDADRLDLGRGIPRDWFAGGREIALRQAPTRWGRVDYATRFAAAARQATATLAFAARGPKEARVRFRLPADTKPVSATVDGRPARLAGDAVIIDARGGGRFEVVVRTR